MGPWRGGKPSDSAWRCPPGLDRAARAAEQDVAAGGRKNRRVTDSVGGPLGSVALRRKADGRRIYAYLRWSEGGQTAESYLGEVDATTRAENLVLAWSLAAERKLVGPELGPATGAGENESDSRAVASSDSTPAVRAVMQGNKGRDTRPELAVRSAVHALGLRYRVGVRPLPQMRRTADLVFPGAKVAVFVDGCFWHGCPSHHRPAKRNSEFWAAKIEGNIARDADTNRQLALAGWRVVRVWEHEDAEAAAASIRLTVRSAAPTQPMLTDLPS